MKGRMVAVVALAVVTGILLLLGQAYASPGITERVSLASDETEGNVFSCAFGTQCATASANGRFVAFSSAAANLVAGDTNGALDIFVRDRQAGTTERVSVASDGTQANGGSLQPGISGNGRFVAFITDSSNLVPGDTNLAFDVFVRDRQTGTTERVSIASDGSQADGSSLGLLNPSISGDGRFVAFESSATNLVAGDTNGASDLFVRDRQSGTTERVSVASEGSQGNAASTVPAISSNGSFVAFQSSATNLVVGDTNGASDIFVRDRQSGTTERVSVASDGSQANAFSAQPGVSANGRFVVFWSETSNLVPGDTNGSIDTFVRDREAGTTERVSVASDGTQANGVSEGNIISDDGRFIVFTSLASNLVAGDTNGAADVFVRDRQNPTTERVSVASAGTQGNGTSEAESISGDGSVIAFQSQASNLVPADTNGVNDVFVHDRAPPVGGIAELPDVAGRPLEAGGSAGHGVGVLAGIAAAIAVGAVALGGVAWARKRDEDPKPPA